MQLFDSTVNPNSKLSILNVNYKLQLLATTVKCLTSLLGLTCQYFMLPQFMNLPKLNIPSQTSNLTPFPSSWNIPTSLQLVGLLVYHLIYLCSLSFSIYVLCENITVIFYLLCEYYLNYFISYILTHTLVPFIHMFRTTCSGNIAHDTMLQHYQLTLSWEAELKISCFSTTK